ncbi:hypothetical protein ASG11_14265 [Sphingomonas sp. Leaf357]|uniref:hypothetical protein n=1 Tax=Sphingomonas sp. Leaf357 TaxID=1736350 RepID=UPI0006F34A44|nr:hypothetical protein [Sphingomonas sp. Leaf357]KQS01974.1 hypothetical protein ASG11_14265 [Sphingomonas sp. Leaf357]
MKIILPSLVAVSLLALTACDNKKGPEVVTSVAPDPQAAEMAKRAPVELPPSIKADVTFRCNPGNSLAFVTFFNGDKQALVKTEKTGIATKLVAAEAGQAFKADGGYELTGTPKGATLTLPGKGKLTCKA